MTKNTDFGEFFYDYVMVGSIIAVVVTVIILLLGLAGLSIEKYDAEQLLIRALQGQETGNKQAQEAAKIVKELITQNKPWDKASQDLTKLKQLRTGGYTTVFLKNNQIFVDYFSGKTKALPVKEYFSRWDFLKVMAIVFWILLAIFSTINFIRESRYYNEELWEWPWKSWWVYPSILMMSPALAPTFIAVKGWRLIVIGYNWFIKLGKKKSPAKEKEM